MAGKISEMTAAGTLTGAELVEVSVGSGSPTTYATRRTTAQAIANLAPDGGLRGFEFTSETGSTADSDPGAGLFKWNHATQSSATYLYFDDATLDAINLDTFYTSLGSSGFIHLQQADDTTKWQVYKWTSTPTDGTGYWKFQVTHQASGGSIADAKTTLVMFIGGGGGGSTAGKHSIWVPASAMLPAAASPCAPLAQVAVAADQPDLVTLDFDASTDEFAVFSIRMPEKWNEGTVTFKALWSHPSTTTNFGVVWGLQGVAVSDDDTIAVAYGTAQTSTDTGGTTNDLYHSPESSAITIAGSISAGDMVFFRAYRDADNGSDTLAVDARLHGIVIYITTAAETDA